MANSAELGPLRCSARRMLEAKLDDRTLGVRVPLRCRLIAEIARGRRVVEVADRVEYCLSVA